jgi:hypothetical protein
MGSPDFFEKQIHKQHVACQGRQRVVCMPTIWLSSGGRKIRAMAFLFKKPNFKVISTKVFNFVPFCPEWPKHFVTIQKTKQFSSHFKSRSVPDFSAKFRPKYSSFISHVLFWS